MSDLALRSSTTPKNIKINEADHAYLLQENIVAEVYGCCYTNFGSAITEMLWSSYLMVICSLCPLSWDGADSADFCECEW